MVISSKIHILVANKPTMRPRYLRNTLVLLFFLLNLTCYGNKAVKSIINYKQPDGTVIQITLHGDESFAYKKNLNGTILEQKGGYLLPSPTLTEEMAIKIWQENREQRALSTTSALSTKSSSSYSTSTFPLPISDNIVNIKVPVLLVEFSDIKFTVPNILEAIEEQLNSPSYATNGATGSVADYFNTNFHNRYTFEFDVCPTIITLPNTLAYYASDTNTALDNNLREMLEKACELALQSGFNLAEYDWLDNGVIASINIIFAGYSQSETGNSDEIWPQYSAVSNFTHNGKTVQSFSCSSELSNIDELKDNLQGIGTFCHEFAHVFGLPDMYDTNGDLEGESNSLCKSLSLMDEGNYLNSGRTPPLFCAIERELIGIEPILPTIGNEYTLKTSSQDGDILKIESINSGEYFLVEYREEKGWDKYIGNSGVVVYHVDKSEAIYGGISSYKRWEYNNINCYSEHPCAKVISYNDQTTIENSFFPGINNVTELNSTSNPALLDWSKRSLEINISDISIGTSQATLSIVEGLSYNAENPTATNFSYTAYQYDCKISWEELTKVTSTSTKWRVRWETSSDNSDSAIDIYGELRTEEQYCYISNLLPGTKYNVYLSYEENGEYGTEVSQSISTLEISSDFPYIPIKGEYTINERLDLRVLNLVESTDSIEWYINSSIIDSDYIELTTSGESTVEVHITYLDNSTEIITKTITVK